jgi:hypothetical protein
MLQMTKLLRNSCLNLNKTKHHLRVPQEKQLAAVTDVYVSGEKLK